MNSMVDRGSTSDLHNQVHALRWFHEIDFGNGLTTPGSIKIPKLKRCSDIIFGRVAVRGRSVIDIGCWDGAFSIEATRQGASRVLATDHYVWHNGWDRRSFELARNHLAPSIEVMDIDISGLSVETVGEFDVVLFMGVFYHLRHPFEALERISKIAKHCLVFESRLLRTLTRKPMMRFYPGAELDNDATNWWAPNRACVEAMLVDLGFSRIIFKHQDRRWRRGIFHAFR